MADEIRHSQAAAADLISDPDERALREVLRGQPASADGHAGSAAARAAVFNWVRGYGGD